MTAWLTPTRSAKASSKAAVRGPIVSQAERTTSATASTSASSKDGRGQRQHATAHWRASTGAKSWSFIRSKSSSAFW